MSFDYHAIENETAVFRRAQINICRSVRPYLKFAVYQALPWCFSPSLKVISLQEMCIERYEGIVLKKLEGY